MTKRFYVRVESHPASHAIVRLSTADELDKTWSSIQDAKIFYRAFLSAEDYEVRFREALGDLLALVERETKGEMKWIAGGFIGEMHLVPKAPQLPL